MTTLNVWIESWASPIGYLRSNEDGGIEFAYSDDWLASPAAHAISFSLPLQPERFGDARTRAYFQNLLPENDQLDRIVVQMGLERNDVVGILSHHGSDLSGALSCLPLDAPPVKRPGLLASDYDWIDREQFVDLVRRLGENRSLPDELRDPSPVAGVQRKIALVALEGDRYAVPKAGTGTPTTHILKVPGPDIKREAFYEVGAARLGSLVGLDVAESRSFWVGDYEVVLARRYDRVVGQDGSVDRLHQEDFAQALGLPPSLKYERNGHANRAFSAAAIARLIAETLSPADARIAFLRSVFFNLAIGNTDNHAKNYALLYDEGAIPRLAPLYDLVPIRISDRHNHLFSFRIGSATQAEELRSDDLLALFATFGLRPVAARRFLRDRIRPMLEILGQPRDISDPWARAFDALIVQESRRILTLIDAIGD